MSSNKSARQQLERVFGKICMVEAAGIRYIPKEKRRKIKGYTKYDDVLTYHHIHEKAKGGKATMENGAIVRGYNHRWIHTLSEEKKEEVNSRLIQFKVDMIQAIGDGLRKTPVAEIDLSLEINPDEEYEVIPVYDNDRKPKEKFNRAKEKRNFQKKVDRYFEGRDDDDDWCL